MARPERSSSPTRRHRVAGYFSLTVGQVDTVEAPERIRQGMGRFPLPVVILARLAVSRENHGRGIGVGMLQDAIRRTLVCLASSPLAVWRQSSWPVRPPELLRGCL